MRFIFLLISVLCVLGTTFAGECDGFTNARTPKPYKMAVCTMIKDEAEYIQEWIEYHILMKVDHFFIYDDGSTDNVGKVLKPYIDTGFVTLLYWHHNRTVDESLVWKDPIFTRNQRFGIADCIYNHKNWTEWFGIWDVDEFPSFTQENFTNFKDLIDDYIIPHQWDNLQIPLAIMGSSNHTEKPKGLVIENYVMRGRDVMFGYSQRRNKFMGKSMYKSGCAHADVHHSNKLQPGCRHQSWWPDLDRDTNYPVHFKHYHSKSFEDYRLKMKKWGWDVTRANFESMESSLNEVKDKDMEPYVKAVTLGMKCRGSR